MTAKEMRKLMEDVKEPQDANIEEKMTEGGPIRGHDNVGKSATFDREQLSSMLQQIFDSYGAVTINNNGDWGEVNGFDHITGQLVYDDENGDEKQTRPAELFKLTGDEGGYTVEILEYFKPKEVNPNSRF